MPGGSQLGQRIVTGVLGAAALISLVLWGGFYGIRFLYVGLAVSVFWEYLQCTQISTHRPSIVRSVLLIAGLVTLWNLVFPEAFLFGSLAGFFPLAGIFLFSVPRGATPGALKERLRSLVFVYFGMVYSVEFLFFLPQIHDFPQGRYWILLFFLIIWATDTGAYFAGRALGNHALYPSISPKKTWEGTIGGLLTAGLVAALYQNWLLAHTHPLLVLLVVFLVSSAGQIGDLFESWIKRSYDVKDSGNLLPGHGGMLDRFDSVVFALPVMYICIHGFF